MQERQCCQFTLPSVSPSASLPFCLSVYLSVCAVCMSTGLLVCAVFPEKNHSSPLVLAVQTVVFPSHNSKPCLLFRVDLGTKANCLDSNSIPPLLYLLLLFSSFKLTFFTWYVHQDFLEIHPLLWCYFFSVCCVCMFFVQGFWTIWDVLVLFQ